MSLLEGPSKPVSQQFTETPTHEMTDHIHHYQTQLDVQQRLMHV